MRPELRCLLVTFGVFKNLVARVTASTEDVRSSVWVPGVNISKVPHVTRKDWRAAPRAEAS